MTTSKSLRKIDTLRIGVHTIGMLPLLQLGVLALTGNLTVNPIQFAQQILGRDAVYLLILSLAVTPTVTVTGWRALIKHRRTLGLYAFGYFALHFFTFAVLDYGLDLTEILRLTTEKPFILIGVSAGIIILLLAITSFRYWMRQMGKGWQNLHRTVYLAGILVIIHYAMALKANLATLSGDIIQPLVLGTILATLLIMRIPPIRKWLSGLRYRIRTGAKPVSASKEWS